MIAALVAIFGHDLLHKSFRVLFWISLPLWIILTGGVLFGGVTGTAATAGGFTFVAFLVQFSVAASYNITYAPYVSDYSRYLPRNTKPSSIIASVFVGAFGIPGLADPARRLDGHLPRRQRRPGGHQRDRQRHHPVPRLACWRSSRRSCWWPRWA